MSIFQKKKTAIFFELQSGIGVPSTIAADDFLEPTLDSTFVQPKGELVDRGLICNSPWPSKQVAGGRWGEGAITLEMRGSGTAGIAPVLGDVLTSLLGTEYPNVADTVNGLGTTTTFTATTGTYNVGQLLRVQIGAGYEVRRVSAVSGQDITVQRAFSQAPADTAIIAAGLTYLHLGTEDPSYGTLDQYLDGLRLYCPDTACESISVGVNERDVIRGDFGFRSLTCTESEETTPFTVSCGSVDPLMGTSCNLIFEGGEYEMKSLEFSATTRRARGGINSAGFSELPFAGAFEAEATMAPWVENKNPITNFFSGAVANAEMTKGDTAGNILHIELVGLQRTAPEIGEDEGDFIWGDPMTITGGIYIGLF